MIIEKNTGKAELCFVKVPEGATAFRIVESNLVSTMPKIYSIGSLRERWTRLPKGNWQIVGNPFELTEEHLSPIVPKMKDSGYPFEIQEITDTWEDILSKWKIYQTNPYGRLILQDSDAGSYLETEIYPQWKMAEERVGSWILLRKI